jgi:GNAT superfamily N-acetyltransferase
LGKYIDYPVVNAVIEGNAPGRVFVDHSENPGSSYILTNAGFSYLVGSPKNEAFNQALKGLLDDELFPRIQTSVDPTLIFYPLADGWETPLKEILGTRKVARLFRKQFVFDKEKFAQKLDWQDKIPSGFTLRPIDQTLLEEVRADMFPWASPLAFLEKGFGFWLMKGGKVTCECSSAFASEEAVEINIHTQEKYQRQGLATIVASAFIEKCLARGLLPNWECWWNNKPSVLLAQKLGFEPTGNHAVFLVELNYE